MQVETTKVQEAHAITAKGQAIIESIHEMTVMTTEGRGVGFKCKGDGAIDGRKELAQAGEPSAFEMATASSGMLEKIESSASVDVPPGKSNADKVGGLSGSA